MLKLLDTTSSFGNLSNTKCAEVFCQSADNFSIVCTHCDLKIFEFNDFLLHFRNVHLLCCDDQVQNTFIKSEIETDDTILNNEYGKDDKHAKDLQEYQEIPIVSDIHFSTPSDEVEVDVEVFLKEVDDDWVAGDGDSDDGSVYNEEIDQNEDNDSTDNEYLSKILKPVSEKKSKIFDCKICDKKYKVAKSLEYHMKKCHSSTVDVTAFNCTKCDKVFQLECALSSHMQRHHTGYQCPDCDKVYKNKETLAVHKFIHTGVRNFKCDVANCGKTFFNPKQLSSHKRLVHIAARNYVCEICGFSTKTRPSLTVHKRSHTGEKPFVCKDCGKAFASQSLLCEHKPIHSTERPHKCDVCGAAFSRPKALYHHKHLHLAVKKFVCKLCGKAYAQGAGLSGHMRQHKAEQMIF